MRFFLGRGSDALPPSPPPLPPLALPPLSSSHVPSHPPAVAIKRLFFDTTPLLFLPTLLPSLHSSLPSLSTNDGLLTDLDAYQLIKERVAKRAADNKEKGKKADKGGEVRSQKTLTKNRDWIEKEVRREGGRRGVMERRGST